MFGLIHLIFMLIKIAIQASVYASLTFIIIYVLSKTTEIVRIKKWMNRKLLTWWLTGLIYSIGLFFYAFSYWGNHGLGDSARIPIGNDLAIHNIDGAWTYFYTDPGNSYNQIQINEFALIENKICAKKSKENGNKFLVFDCENSEMMEFENQQQYEDYALKNNLPVTNKFKDFFFYYQEFWSGWRSYLLP